MPDCGAAAAVDVAGAASARTAVRPTIARPRRMRRRGVRTVVWRRGVRALPCMSRSRSAIAVRPPKLTRVYDSETYTIYYPERHAVKPQTCSGGGGALGNPAVCGPFQTMTPND